MMWTICRLSLFLLVSVGLHLVFFFWPLFLKPIDSEKVFLPVEIGSASSGKRATRKEGSGSGSQATKSESISGVNLTEIESYGNQLPEYPPSALRQRIEGTVKISITVNDSTVETKIAGPSPQETLNESVREAISEWKFPGTFLQKYKGKTFLIPFHFKISE